MNKPIHVVYINGQQSEPMTRNGLADLIRRFRRERYKFNRNTVRNYQGIPRARKYVADVPNTLAFTFFM